MVKVKESQLTQAQRRKQDRGISPHLLYSGVEQMTMKSFLGAPSLYDRDCGQKLSASEADIRCLQSRNVPTGRRQDCN